VALLLVAAVYGILIGEWGALHANVLIDGLIGVGLGLFICSFPASAAVDLLYMDRLALQRLASEWTDVAWVGLNLLVMVAGCMVTVVGATRFVG
jgi:magnesium-transporting ATPase (P-type)